MWKNLSVNLLKRAFNLTSRPGPTVRTTYHCTAFSGSPPFCRYCGPASKEEKNGITYAETKRLMNVEALKEKLRMENREVISCAELARACETLGVAKTPDEATVFFSGPRRTRRRF